MILVDALEEARQEAAEAALFKEIVVVCEWNASKVPQDFQVKPPNIFKVKIMFFQNKLNRMLEDARENAL